MANPNPRRYYSDQATLNYLFEFYNITFRDPTHLADTLVELIEAELALDDVEFADEDGFYSWVRSTPVRQIWNIIDDINELDQHRHRVDATNILTAVTARILGGEPAAPLVPDPREPDYEGADAQAPEHTYAELEAHFSAEIAEMAALLPYDPDTAAFPKPPARAARPNRRSAGVPWNNEAVSALVLQGAAATAETRAAVLNMLSGGEHPATYRPPVYRDDPAEICLAMPEDCAFITADTPTSTRLRRAIGRERPALEILDYRVAGAGLTRRLPEDHYVYQLVELVRDTVADPAVARAYAIIFRAEPTAWAAGGDDEIVNEEPPSIEEIECVVAFMTQAFPQIEIRSATVGEVAFHDRLEPNVIQVSSEVLANIEQGQADGAGISHLLYHLFASLIHELGHWFYSAIYLQGLVLPGALHTPRKLRLLIRATGDAEDPRHPEHVMTSVFFGEMGQLIEWLVFGHLADTNTNRPGVLVVTCFGSYAGQGAGQITINSYAGARLLAVRPPVRMGAEMLRSFLASVAAEEAAAAARTEEEGEEGEEGEEEAVIGGWPVRDLEMPDAEEEYAGRSVGANRRYRRAVQRLRAETQRVERGMPAMPAPAEYTAAYGGDETVRPAGAVACWGAAGSVVFGVLAGATVGVAGCGGPAWGGAWESPRVAWSAGLSGAVVLAGLFAVLLVLFLGCL